MGRISVESDDNGNNQNTFVYQASSTFVTDALGRRTEYDWFSVQGSSRVTRIVDAIGGVTLMAYDSNLNKISETNPLSHTTKAQYDINGNITAVTDANGNSSQATYNNFAEPTSQIDQKGNKTTLTYDANGNLITSQDALGDLSNNGFDAQGHMTSAKDPLGNTSGFGYDGNGALASVVDPLNRVDSMSNDALSRLLQNTDPAGRKTSFVYDAAGNMTQAQDALSGVASYAYRTGRGARDLQTLTDANGHTTTFGYDTIGRPTSVTNALNQSASTAYDKQGNPTSITTKNGQTITLAYDSLNRLGAMMLPEGQISYGYDAAGNLLSAAKYNGTALSYAYDSLNRITRLTETLDNGFSDAATFAHDANSNRTSMSSTLGSLTYGYDVLDRLTSLVSGAGSFAFTYDADSRLTSVIYPNGIKETLAYDAASQVTQIIHQKTNDQTAVAFVNYAYDASGNRTTLSESAGTHSFGYDSLDRLTSASHPAGSNLPVLSEAFAFDAVGNRTADALRTSYQYDAANRIVSDSSITYTSDANGNRTSQSSRATGQTMTFKYDSQSRLIEVDGPTGAVIATYKHDPGGRRIEKAVGGMVTRFAFDGPIVRAILDGDNSVIAKFTYMPGVPTPLAMQVLSTSRTDFRPGTYFLHADALGSVIAVTDTSGNLVETSEYEAFGRAVVMDAQGGIHDRSTVGNPFQFAGMTADPETALNQATYREQDPETGGFLQEDPIGYLFGETNLFAYVEDEPTSLRDPLGLYGDPDYPGPGHRWPPGGKPQPQPNRDPIAEHQCYSQFFFAEGVDTGDVEIVTGVGAGIGKVFGGKTGGLVCGTLAGLAYKGYDHLKNLHDLKNCLADATRPPSPHTPVSVGPARNPPPQRIPGPTAQPL